MANEWTILKLLQWTTEYFDGKGIEGPRLNAEHIIAHALKVSRMDLYLQFERCMTEQNLAEVKALIQRRALREPLQYILGSQPFRNINILVDKSVLIPRPETEIVVQKAIELVDLKKYDGAIYILDLCTGSGVIAAAIASEKQDVMITATDQSEAALLIAAQNIEQWKDRISLLHGDLFEPVGGKKFDLIISNPPYVSESDFTDLQPEVKDYEPKEALLAGKDGLDFYRRIVNDAHKYLNDDGYLVLELGDGSADQVSELARMTEQFISVEVFPDLNKKPRVLVVKLKNKMGS